MLCLKVLSVLMVVEMSLAKFINREEEGHPVGYLSDCKYLIQREECEAVQIIPEKIRIITLLIRK